MLVWFYSHLVCKVQGHYQRRHIEYLGFPWCSVTCPYITVITPFRLSGQANLCFSSENFEYSLCLSRPLCLSSSFASAWWSWRTEKSQRHHLGKMVIRSKQGCWALLKEWTILWLKESLGCVGKGNYMHLINKCFYHCNTLLFWKLS